MIDPKVKVNGYAKGNDQFLAAGLEIYTLNLPNADMTAAGTSQYVLDAVIQTISSVCAPVLLQAPTAHALVFALDRKGLPVIGTATAGQPATVQDKIVALGNASVAITFNTDVNTGAVTGATFADMTGATIVGGATVASDTSFGG